MITIDLSTLYEETAKLEHIQMYVEKVLALADNGDEITLTGRAPIWLYLIIAHKLHGKAKKMIYKSPVTGEITIFDHNPF